MVTVLGFVLCCSGVWVRWFTISTASASGDVLWSAVVTVGLRGSCEVGRVVLPDLWWVQLGLVSGKSPGNITLHCIVEG